MNCDTSTQVENKLRMESLGLIYPVSGGIQFDVTAVKEPIGGKFFRATSFCDHNCRLTTNGQPTGNYECPSAITNHRGLKIATMAPADKIIEGIRRTAEGIRQANQRRFVGCGLSTTYFEKFEIPSIAQITIKMMLESPRIEVNLFGGNPERHPEIIEISRTLRSEGFVVNLTTTGLRFMKDSNFLEKTLANPPNMIAMSADDFESSDQVRELSQLTMDEIRTKWGRLRIETGQRRKTLEAIFVAKLAAVTPNFPKVLFNIVVHRSNLDHIEEIIEELHRCFLKVILNPYPVQTSFGYQKPEWQESDLSRLEEFVDRRIDEHIDQKGGIVRRLHYYLMLKAIFGTFRDTSNRLVNMLSGYDVWKCYDTLGAGRYVKVGISPERQYEGQIAGGHLACFWNAVTITSRDQVWNMEPTAITDYIMGGMRRLAIHRSRPCPGCIMPRLNFDLVSLELGMNPEIVPTYLKLRKIYAGF